MIFKKDLDSWYSEDFFDDSEKSLRLEKNYFNKNYTKYDMISKHKFRPKLFGDFLKMIMNLFFK
jgi:hypothetical protein